MAGLEEALGQQVGVLSRGSTDTAGRAGTLPQEVVRWARRCQVPRSRGGQGSPCGGSKISVCLEARSASLLEPVTAMAGLAYQIHRQLLQLVQFSAREQGIPLRKRPWDPIAWTQAPRTGQLQHKVPAPEASARPRNGEGMRPTYPQGESKQ